MIRQRLRTDFVTTTITVTVIREDYDNYSIDWGLN